MRLNSFRCFPSAFVFLRRFTWIIDSMPAIVCYLQIAMSAVDASVFLHRSYIWLVTWSACVRIGVSVNGSATRATKHFVTHLACNNICSRTPARDRTNATSARKRSTVRTICADTVELTQVIVNFLLSLLWQNWYRYAWKVHGSSWSLLCWCCCCFSCRGVVAVAFTKTMLLLLLFCLSFSGIIFCLLGFPRDG